MEINEQLIEKIVRKVLTEQENGGLNALRDVDKSGIMSIDTNKVQCEPFPFPIESKDVYLKDIISVDESPRLGAGMMELRNGTSFSWTLEYDEIDYIVEGTLEIIIDGRKISAGVGETIFIPKGSSISFSTPSNTRFLYVVYPANWSEQ